MPRIRRLSPRHVVGCLSFVALLTVVATAEAQTITIDFESDSAGVKPNGFMSVDSALVSFSESGGPNLRVDDYGSSSHGQALATTGNARDFLRMDFLVPMQSITLSFGNDDPCCSVPGDKVELRIFRAGTLIAIAHVVMNRNDAMDQTIGLSGVVFDRAELFYDATPSGLSEILDDLILEPVGLLVLDGLGGVFPPSANSSPNTPTPYFGFDIARDLEPAATGFYVLDGFGGVHPGGGAPVLSPATPYFGFDIARDLELAQPGFFVLDGFGGLHAGGGAFPMNPGPPYFGFDAAEDLELAATGYYVLDAFGGVHAGGGAPVMSPTTPYFGFDIARDLELAGTGYFVLDGFGGLHAGGGAAPMSPGPPYFGFDAAEDLELVPPGFYVLDAFGAVHIGGGAPVLASPAPYFGFDIARDLEIR